MTSLGNIAMEGLWLGNVQAKSAWLGDKEIWSGEQPGPVAGDWLCFTAVQANSTVRLDKVGAPGVVSLETSTDGVAWADYTWSDSTGGTLTLANDGDKVYMRAKNENQTIGGSNSNCYKFVMTGKIAASGNI